MSYNRDSYHLGNGGVYSGVQLVVGEVVGEGNAMDVCSGWLEPGDVSAAALSTLISVVQNFSEIGQSAERFN